MKKITVSKGEKPGHIKLEWAAVPGAKSYLLAVNDAAGNQLLSDTETKEVSYIMEIPDGCKAIYVYLYTKMSDDTTTIETDNEQHLIDVSSSPEIVIHEVTLEKKSNGDVTVKWCDGSTGDRKFVVQVYKKNGTFQIFNTSAAINTGFFAFNLHSIPQFGSGQVCVNVYEVAPNGSYEKNPDGTIKGEPLKNPGLVIFNQMPTKEKESRGNPPGGTPVQTAPPQATSPQAAATPASAGGAPAQAATPQAATTSTPAGGTTTQAAPPQATPPQAAPSDRWKFQLPKINLSAVPFGGVFKIFGYIVIGLLIMFCIGWIVQNIGALCDLFAITPSPSRAGGSELVVSNGVVRSSRPRLNVGVPEVSVQGTNNSVQIFVTGDNSPVYYGVPPQQQNQSAPILETPPLSVSRDPVNPRPIDLAPGFSVGEHILVRSGDKSFDLLPGQKAVIEKNGSLRPVLTPQTWPREARYNTTVLPNGDILVVNVSDYTINLALSWQ